MNLIPGHSRIWQADGENNWSKIGSAEYESLEMPQNGYIVAYLSNQSAQEAWFDNMNVGISNGMLLEERHYYAYGLPIAGLGSQASNASRNRQRYQGNEYIEERGLDWMDFHNRQYDPQLGRFLSIDPLADAGGQQVLSPYHAMGCNPVSMVDPLGLQTGLAPGTKLMNFMPPNAGVAYIEGKLVVLGANFLNLESMQLRASDRFTDFLVEVAIRDAWGGQKKGSESGQSGVPESGSVGSGKQSEYTTNVTEEGTGDAYTIVATAPRPKHSWFSRTLKSIKKFFSSIEVEGSIVYSFGVQGGVGINTPIGGLGFEANAYSVDLLSIKDIVNGKDDAEENYIGKDRWINIRQGAGFDFILGGISLEREMRSPPGGGAFFDKKITEETKILGYYDKKEYYEGGLQSQSYPKQPTYSNGMKFGFNIQFFLGAKIDIEIRRK